MRYDGAPLLFVALYLLSSSPCSAWVSRGSARRPHVMQLFQESKWQDTVADAMKLTQSMGGDSNISAAHDAVDLWKEVLYQDPAHDSSETAMPTAIRGLCLTLYGTCLVRIGRDSQALDVFAQALNQRQTTEDGTTRLLLDEKTRQTALLGRAACFQRLGRYGTALEEYQKASTIEGTWGALVCALRMGDSTLARDILTMNEAPMEDTRFQQASEILQFLDSGNVQSSIPTSQVGAWLCNNKKLPSIATMLEFNVGPFDDPLLIELDDKIRLHELLTRTGNDAETEQFWPTSFVFPQQLSEFTAHQFDPSSQWILKARSGYGSHGNAFMTAGDIADTKVPPEGVSDSCKLLQKVVTRPMLIQGRVFSLRMYVIYFLRDTKHYVSKHGLVKLAALPYREAVDDIGATADPRSLMTNSGRESNADQLEWQTFLEKHCGLDQREALQNKIARTVDVVMDLYHRHTRSNSMKGYRSQLARVGLPKIMGWDFLVDARDCNPWLIEVNRFPGLEARDKQDARVKQAVLEEAWKIASYRKR